MKTPELKPCPFCHSHASVIKTNLGGFAECNKYGHIHNAGTFGNELCATKEQAIIAWNRRVTDENAQAEDLSILRG